MTPYEWVMWGIYAVSLMLVAGFFIRYTEWHDVSRSDFVTGAFFIICPVANTLLVAIAIGYLLFEDDNVWTRWWRKPLMKAKK